MQPGTLSYQSMPQVKAHDPKDHNHVITTAAFPLPRDIPWASHNLGLASYLVATPSILRLMEI